jgi:hypothetical protein
MKWRKDDPVLVETFCPVHMYFKNVAMNFDLLVIPINRVEPGYNDVGLYDTSLIELDIV